MSWIRAGCLLALTAVAQSPGGAKNPASIECVKIAPGEFVMGCAEGDKDCIEDEVPRHRVRLTKGFELAKYDVTRAQWDAVMGPGSNPSKGSSPTSTSRRSPISRSLD
jgi:formylglycine-generating enzyme required for sulfatase activity